MNFFFFFSDTKNFLPQGFTAVLLQTAVSFFLIELNLLTNRSNAECHADWSGWSRRKRDIFWLDRNGITCLAHCFHTLIHI